MAWHLPTHIVYLSTEQMFCSIRCMNCYRNSCAAIWLMVIFCSFQRARLPLVPTKRSWDWAKGFFLDWSAGWSQRSFYVLWSYNIIFIFQSNICIPWNVRCKRINYKAVHLKLKQSRSLLIHVLILFIFPSWLSLIWKHKNDPFVFQTNWICILTSRVR